MPVKRLRPEELVAKLLNMEGLPKTPLATIAMTTMKHVTWKLMLAGNLHGRTSSWPPRVIKRSTSSKARS